jgi:hypothetical protein
MLELFGQCQTRCAERGRARRISAVHHDVGGACQFDQPVTVGSSIRVQHRAALVRVAQRERNAGARHTRQRVARRAAVGRLNFQHFGAEVGEQPADPVGVGAAEIEHPNRFK